MSYCTPETTQKARKAHQCTNCCEAINPGDTYVRWTSFDDSAFVNKMHPECLESLQEGEGLSFEYTPYSGERPESVGAAS